MGKLSVRKVMALTKPGLHGDGDGLWLQIGPNGSKSWGFRYMREGRARQAGLGPVDLVSLQEARNVAHGMRRQLFEGLDPLEERRAARAAARAGGAAMTFRQCAESFLRDNQAQWKNAKHCAQWASSLEAYAFPMLGHLPVADVTTAEVLRCLRPIWLTKSETASRVQQRLARILDWAKASGFRTGDNPAAWRGHLDKLLPSRSSLAKVEHHPALAWSDLPAFMNELRANTFISASALEYIILTISRTGEAIGAQWSEVNGDNLWTVPEIRMKPGVEHVVPLSRQAIALLDGLPRLVGNPHIFPGSRTGKPLSNMACLELLRGMRPGLTVHGFRSSFRDWAYENTEHANEVVEACMSHQIKDKAEAAYRRGLAIERRRAVLQDWADYCYGR